MKLIVGLGNPGVEYAHTRHNIGFKAIDAYAHAQGLELNKNKFMSRYCKSDNFILAQPLTYMNNSGAAVLKLKQFYKINLADILIIYDDLDMPTGKLRYRAQGSSGGQKGIADIMDKLGTQTIKRFKIGIGRPKNGAKNWVLGSFTPLQIKLLNEQKPAIIEFIDKFIKGA